ncbi:hypothetical protein C8Q80DRAFT_81564 [Daedaleopsis nitida]|nr:hypothetical protein C8Q80DRAFT_81564 [Daedaleopsis nitida]
MWVWVVSWNVYVLLWRRASLGQAGAGVKIRLKKSTRWKSDRPVVVVIFRSQFVMLLLPLTAVLPAQ